MPRTSPPPGHYPPSGPGPAGNWLGGQPDQATTRGAWAAAAPPDAGQKPDSGADLARGADSARSAGFDRPEDPSRTVRPDRPGDPGRAVDSDRPSDLDRTVSLNRPVDLDRTVSLNRPADPDRTAALGPVASSRTAGATPGPGANKPATAGPGMGGSAQQGSGTVSPAGSGSVPGNAVPGNAVPGNAVPGRGEQPGRNGLAGQNGPAGTDSRQAGTASGPGTPGGPARAGEQGTPAEGGIYGRASAPLNSARASVPAAPPAARPGATPSTGTGGGEDPGKTGPGRKSRTKLMVALAVLVLIAMVGAVGVVVRPGPVDGWLDALAGEPADSPAPVTAIPEPTPTPVLVAARALGTAPDPAAVRAALDPLVNASALGSTVHVSVLDVASDTILYERDPDKMTTPASTTKVLTAATVLAARGPAYRLTTRVVAGSEPGEVVIIGGGDASLAVDEDDKDLFPGAARLDDLAAQVEAALGGTKPTRVLVDTSLFTGPETAAGWSSDDITPGGQVARIQSLMTNGGRVEPVHNEFGGDPRFADPSLSAGRLFAKMIGVPQAAVKKGAVAGSAAEPAPSASAGGAWTPGAELGKVESPPLVQIVDWMLQQSDNVLAEALGRQVALAAGKEASFAGTAEAMNDKLRELGLPAGEAELFDASGLSNRNGISPALLVRTLALAAGDSQPALGNIFNGLPVAGWSGTLETRFATPSGNATAQGIVRAKTGSLTGVNSLAGVLVTREQRVLAFAIMAKGGPDAITARAALDEVAARLVACGC